VLPLGNAFVAKSKLPGTSGDVPRCFGMATHGDNRINGKPPHPAEEAEVVRRTNGSFPGTDSDQWHRTLTGRQSPEPVSAKLRMIYGSVVAEKLPDQMLDLLAQLDQKSPKL
jgi:hypothetical protein